MKNYLIVALVVILLSSCAESITRGQQYAKLYEEKPVSIVVMPPINQTNAVEAKDFFIQRCICHFAKKAIMCIRLI